MVKMNEEKQYCYKYPHPSITTDCVIFGYDVKDGLSLLLIERKAEPFKGRWAFPGGFMHIDEDTESCARRELQEETALTAAVLEQLGCYSDVNRDPRERVVTIAYYGIIKKSNVVGGDDAKDARWFALNEIPTLAFDHDRILRDAVHKLKEKIHFEPIGFELLPDVFTMPQLQELYESILNVKFDRRNFANKILKLGLLKEYGERPKNKGSRIPIKYTFKLIKIFNNLFIVVQNTFDNIFICVIHCYQLSICRKPLGTYAVITVTKSSTITPTLCCPCHPATLPITPLNTPSITFTSCPFSNLGTSTKDTMVLSASAAQIIFKLSI